MNRGRWSKWRDAGRYGFLQLEYIVRTRTGKKGTEVQFAMKNPIVITIPFHSKTRNLEGVLRFKTSSK